MAAIILVLIGAINWGLVGAIEINVVESLNKATFNHSLFPRLIYVVVGLSALYLAIQRDTYLPFLGETVIPVSVFKEHKPVQSEKEFKIKDSRATYLVFWASNKKNGTTVVNVKNAYGNFDNSGVSKFIDGVATISVACPQRYYVERVFKKRLPKHVHYRLVYPNGMLSSVRTLNVEKDCNGL
jgi:uncharacterized membrane protein YuzA (DUF378 family)